MTEDTPEPVERSTADRGQQKSSHTGGQQGEQDADRVRRSRLRRRRGAVAVVVALATAVAGTWAAGVGPFAKDRYCWGAWVEGSGPRLLGDRELRVSGAGRTAEESAAPSAERPSGTCTLRITSSIEDNHRGAYDSGNASGKSGTIEFDKTVTVTYGPVPETEKERLDWLGTFLDADLSPLPDGVPGLVGPRKGMVVLPEECDVDGLPTTVVISGEETGYGHLGPVDMPMSIGDEWDVAELLFAVANDGMRRVGCVPDQPLRITSPIEEIDSGDPSDGIVGSSATCRVPGLGFKVAKGAHYDAKTGAVDDTVQLCTLLNTQSVRYPKFGGQFVMAAQPRLRALFHGLAGDRSPGRGWRGKGRLGGSSSIADVVCKDTPTVFFLQLDGYLSGAAEPDPERVFARAVNSVAERMGCPAPAPKP